MSQGLVLGGRYRLQSPLGQGGMGEVWRAEHMKLRVPRAIKLMHPSIASNSEFSRRFLREAQAAASLSSPHVVQIHDFDVDQDRAYLVMELLEGESLAQRLSRVGRLSPSETAFILGQVGRAVAKAHESKIVHRDLKPDNIYIVRGDQYEVAKVLDFGLAKRPWVGLSGAAPTRTAALVGTPNYMSPEQINNSGNIDFRADIWALGVIAYECLVGQPLFVPEKLLDLMRSICEKPLPDPSRQPGIPVGFEAWFARAVARDPEERFASVTLAMAELRGVLGANSDPPPAAHLPVTQTVTFDSFSVPGPSVSLRRVRHRLGMWRSLAAAVGLVVVSASGGFCIGRLRSATEPRGSQPSVEAAIASSECVADGGSPDSAVAIPPPVAPQASNQGRPSAHAPEPQAMGGWPASTKPSTNPHRPAAPTTVSPRPPPPPADPAPVAEKEDNDPFGLYPKGTNH